jgi:hypothetical protein
MKRAHFSPMNTVVYGPDTPKSQSHAIEPRLECTFRELCSPECMILQRNFQRYLKDKLTEAYHTWQSTRRFTVV